MTDEACLCPRNVITPCPPASLPLSPAVLVWAVSPLVFLVLKTQLHTDIPRHEAQGRGSPGPPFLTPSLAGGSRPCHLLWLL